MMKIAIACLLLAALITAQNTDDAFAAGEKDFATGEKAFVEDTTPNNDDVVPTDEAIHKEAQTHIEGLLQSGKTQDACKSLADSSIKAISDSVKNAQKIMNAVPKGASCKKEGQPAVDAATKTNNAAAKKVKDAKAASGTAKSAPVKFKGVTMASLKGGDCAAFFSDPAYTAAKKTAEAAGNKSAKAEGEAKVAKKALDDALEAQKYAIHVCACKVQREHKKAKDAADKANSGENAKAWKKSHMMKCVLAGTAMNACKVPAAPKVTVPALEAPAKGAKCGATNFKTTTAQTGCQVAVSKKIEYLDRQHLNAYPGGTSLKKFALSRNGCSGNKMRYYQTSIATPPVKSRSIAKSTGCTEFNKKLEYLDQQWPNCGNHAAIASFKVIGGCGGSKRRYQYYCNNFDPKYVGGVKWVNNPCTPMSGKKLEYLSRQHVKCPANTALAEFGVTRKGCSGDNMRYSYKCLELNY
jgi:hypothetical protein